MIVLRPAGHYRLVGGAGDLKVPDAVTPGEPTSAERVTALVTTHFDFVWRLVRRLGVPAADADDATQQVFMIATQKLASIAVGTERSFLYGVAQRVASNARRGLKRRQAAAASSELDVRAMPPPLDPEQRSELAQARDLLDELLSRLPEELARVLVLAEIEQLSMSEIAELELLPVGTAASRLRRARAAFLEQLAEDAHRNPFKDGER